MLKLNINNFMLKSFVYLDEIVFKKWLLLYIYFQYLIIATQSLLLRQWKWKEKELVRSWKVGVPVEIHCQKYSVLGLIWIQPV